MPKASSSAESTIVIKEVVTGLAEVYIVGRTPLIHNRVSQKALHELLAPRKKTAADRAVSQKHDPLKEYQDSPYILTDDDQPTYIALLATAFKGAMRTAALDLPGAKKSQIGRLTYVEGDKVGIYGVPEMLMAVTRSADINRTPDVRTRAIMRRWAAKLTIRYQKPLLTQGAIANLINAAGSTVGVGDWRQEKGSGNFGLFRIVPEDDPDFLDIMQTGGRAAQVAALETTAPRFFDEDTAELYSWFVDEMEQRRQAGSPQQTRRKAAHTGVMNGRGTDDHVDTAIV